MTVRRGYEAIVDFNLEDGRLACSRIFRRSQGRRLSAKTTRSLSATVGELWGNFPRGCVRGGI